MKVLFDINHPAHVHFFANPARLLIDHGHEVIFTTRDKDVTIDLIDQYGFPHVVLTAASSGGVFQLIKELFLRNYLLWKIVRNEKPKIMAAIGGTFIAHVGFLSRVPSIVFYDTENAKLQNAITYPFAKLVVVPECYKAWVPRKHIRYCGYHELSYLRPAYFSPDRSLAIKYGLKAGVDNILVRLVSWNANHDIGERGWSRELLSQLIDRYGSRTHIIISSESALDKSFASYLYRGPAKHLLHVLAHCRLFVGESATMASESAVLGVPAIYAANTGRGYTDEQENKYGLVRNVRVLDRDILFTAIDEMLGRDTDDIGLAKERLLGETIDVAEFVKDLLLKKAKG